MSFPFYYLKVWGMSFSDKIFMTKIQRPQIFVCQKYFIALRTTNKKKLFCGYLFVPYQKWKAWGAKWWDFFGPMPGLSNVHGIWDAGAQGSWGYPLVSIRVLGGQCSGFLLGPCLAYPFWGYSFSILWYQTNTSGRKGTYVSEFYFKGIVL